MKVKQKAVAMLIAMSFVGAILGSYVGAAASTTPDYKMGALFVSPQQYSEITGTQFIPLTEEAYKQLIQLAFQLPNPPQISQEALYSVITSPSSDTTTSSLPSSVNNSLYLPPIGDQGHVGSCVAWSSTYYVYTYMTNWFRGHKHPTGNYVMNPTFIYNLINKGIDHGAFPEDAMNAISTIGAVPMNDFPLYVKGDKGDPPDYAWVWPNESQWKDAMVNKGSPEMYNALLNGGVSGGKIYVVDLSNETQFNYLKGLLAAGYIVQTTIIVYKNFYGFDKDNNIYALNQEHDSAVGRHAVTIVGYDDNLKTPDGKGAFLMVNSWGTDWGDGGYWWLTYPAAKGEEKFEYYDFETVKLSDGYAYIYVPESREPRKPVVYSVLHITHSKRGEVIGGVNGSVHGGIELGIGSQDSPIWNRWFLNFYMGSRSSDASYLAEYQNHSFPSSPMAFDLSDGMPALASQVDSQYVPFFIHVADKYKDKVTGKLDLFSIVFNSTYLRGMVSATGMPKAIPEDGHWLTVSVNVPVAEYTGMSPMPGAVIHTNWAYIGVGSLFNISKATLKLDGKTYTMKNDSATHFYYNVTDLSNKAYTYSVSITFKNGKTVTLPQRTFTVNTGKLTSYVPVGPSSWPSMDTLSPGDVKYSNGTFMWKNAAEGEKSPFTGIKYHLTGVEAKYNSADGVLMLRIGVTPLNNLGSIPSSLINVSLDTNGDGKVDYYAVIDLAKPGTKTGIANIMDLYSSNGTNVANLKTLFIPDTSSSAVYLQIPAKLINITEKSNIGIKVQLYENDDVYGALDTMTTSKGSTTATISFTQVPMLSNASLIGLVLLLGVFLFWKRN